jgi:phosphotransferase system enzyme I (PtsI)
MEGKLMIKGIGASTGIAIGKAFVLPAWEWEAPEKDIDVNDLAAEFERLNAGIRTSKQEIKFIKEEISGVIGKEESSIFDAHLAILDDPIFMHEIQGIIQRQYKAAEVAVKEAIDKFANMFDLLDDEYMKERALDIKDVGNRLLKHLLGTPEVTLPKDTQPFILVAKELSPSQLAHLNPDHVLGIVNMVGGRTSHSAIMARALGIPFVLGIEGKLEEPIATEDLLVIDGEEGTVFINPDTSIIEVYQERKQRWMESRKKLQQIVGVPTVTKDGLPVTLDVNISSIKELEQGLNNGACGVGLFRTEFVYMDRNSFPTEDEQFEIYKLAAEKLGSKPIIIRSLDIGGDKELDYLDFPEEDNPFLGYRAIRICLDQPDLFKTQLKAILRASKFGNVKLMYPMLTSVDEVRRANEILEEAKNELLVKGIPFDPKMEVGITIEVPSAVAIADLLAQEVDFFSIGTNDLIQYVLAVDRMNEHISHLYDPFHPAIIRMLKQTADAAKAYNIGISVCGEMAGDIRSIPIWLGLGIHSLSMSGQSILQVKETILKSNESDCKALLERMLLCKTGAEIQRLLEQNLPATQENGG